MLDSTICVLKSLAIPVARTLAPLRYPRTHKRSHRCTRTYPPIAGLWGRLACCVQVCGWLCESAPVSPLLTCIPSSPSSLWPSSIQLSLLLPPEQMPKGPSASRGPVASTKSLDPDMWSCPCVSLSMADLAVAHWWTTSQLSLGDVVHGC